MKLLSQILNACHLTPFTVWLIQCCWFNDTFTYVSKPFAFCFVCFTNRQFALFSSIWTSISWSNTVSITHDEQRRKKKSIDLVHPLGSSCRHKLITFNFYFWSAVVITISIFSLYIFYFDHFKPWRFYRLSIIRTTFIDVHTLPFFRENIFKSEHGFWWANTFTDLWLKLVYCHWWIAQTTKKKQQLAANKWRAKYRNVSKCLSFVQVRSLESRDTQIDIKFNERMDAVCAV